MAATVSLDSRVSVAPDVFTKIFPSQGVILDLKSEEYFGLDDVGARMWQLLTTSPSVEEAYRALLEEYEVEPEQLRRDLSEFAGQLVERGLLEVHAGKVAEA